MSNSSTFCKGSACIETAAGILPKDVSSKVEWPLRPCNVCLFHATSSYYENSRISHRGLLPGYTMESVGFIDIPYQGCIL